MSIEALIQAHTEALLANTEAVKLLTLSLAGRSATTASKAADAVEKPKADKAAVKVIADEIVAGEITDPIREDSKAETIAEETLSAIEATEPVPYETVRALVLKLAGAGKREQLKANNVKYGIANAKEFLSNADDFNTVIDQAKLDAYYADLLALEA